MRDSCIFYRSFFDAILTLGQDEQNALFRAVFDYSFDQKEPELEGLTKMMFNLFKPVINSNIKNWKNGSKPKRKRKGSQTEAKPKRKTSQSEAYKDKDKDKDVDKDNNKDEYNNYTFDRFWSMYGKKEKKSEAQKKFEKLKTEELEKIFETLPAFIKANKDLKYRPFPSTYLNQRRWEDELGVESKPKQVQEINNDW